MAALLVTHKAHRLVSKIVVGTTWSLSFVVKSMAIHPIAIVRTTKAPKLDVMAENMMVFGVSLLQT